ncbi:MAG: polysaccharide biosynthesis tyrosine autokinase [Candidatus Omnitrophota bacterium]|nr:polysaccharide biosynthesis tyrosine autokinase [Candidatus Omnitrophota bacterium]
MIPSSELKNVTIFDYLRIVLNRWKLVALCVLISCVCAAAFYLYQFHLKRPEYRATATILIEQHPVIDTLKVAGLTGDLPVMDVEVLVEHIQTMEFAEQVAKRLGRDDPVVLLSMVEAEIPETGTRKISNILNISVTGTKPKEVARIANMWIQEIVRNDVETRRELIEYGASWLGRSREEVGLKLKKAEEDLKEFTETNKGIEFKAKSIGRLQKQLDEMDDALQDLSLKYKEKHPAIFSLKRRRAIVEEQINKLKVGEVSLEKQEEEILQYNLLEQQVKTLRKMYSEFLQASEKADISKDLVLPAIQVIGSAEVFRKPVMIESPANYVATIIFLGFLIGIGLSFGLEYLDRTVKTAEEVEFYAKLPFLGYIPSVGISMISVKDPNLITFSRQDSQIAETFRNLKSSLIFAAPEDVHLRTIMVTSSLPREGVTFVASNLAISFALGGESTLLIDGDMRKGVLTRSYNYKQKRGLSDLLGGKASMHKAVLSTDIPDLSIIGAGTLTPKASDLLGTGKLKGVFEELRSRFQRIVLDVSAVLKFADGLYFAAESDAIVYVIAAGHTELKNILRGSSKISEPETPAVIKGSQAQIMGAVLNESRQKKSLREQISELREEASKVHL